MIASTNNLPSLPTLLVVDACPGVLEASLAQLGPYCQQVLTAAGKAQALEVWQARPELRLCVVDLRLPDENGVEAEEVGFQLLEELARRAGALVVVRSARDTTENRRRARNLGARNFVTRTESTEELVKGLEGLIQRAAATADPPGTVRPLTADERRQVEDHDWCLSRWDQLPQYAGQVVAVYRQQIWGFGPDDAAAIRCAEQTLAERAGQEGLPALDDLIYVVVPRRVAPPLIPSY